MSYIPLIRFRPREISAFAHPLKNAQVFIAALIIIAKNPRQSKWPSMGKWVSKLCYSCTMAYNLAGKKKEHWYTVYNNMDASQKHVLTKVVVIA